MNTRTRSALLTVALLGAITCLAASFVSTPIAAPPGAPAGVTNVAPTSLTLADIMSPDRTGARLEIQFKGTTNSASDTVTFWYQTSADGGTTWDTPVESLFKLEARANGTNAVVVSDYFEMVGAKEIRLGMISNANAQAVTIIRSRLCYAP